MEELTLWVELDDSNDQLVVRAGGDLDFTNQHRLFALLEEGAHGQAMIVDLRQTHFIGSRALELLQRAAARRVAAGEPFEVWTSSSLPRRVGVILGWTELVDCLDHRTSERERSATVALR